MNRRGALQVLAAVGAALTQTITTGTFNWYPGPPKLVFYLDQYKSIDVHYKGEVVSIDPAEMFAALKESK